MICPHCGKPESTLKEEIAQLHEQGLTPPEIRAKLVSQGWGKSKTSKAQLMQIHQVLTTSLGQKPHKKPQKIRVI